MKRNELMPSRTLRVIFLTVILLVGMALALPRRADAALILRAQIGPVKIVSTPYAKSLVIGQPACNKYVKVHKAHRKSYRRNHRGRHAVLLKNVRRGATVRCSCRQHRVDRFWVAGHWVRTGPRTSRWVIGHWERS